MSGSQSTSMEVDDVFDITLHFDGSPSTSQALEPLSGISSQGTDVVFQYQPEILKGRNGECL